MLPSIPRNKIAAAILAGAVGLGGCSNSGEREAKYLQRAEAALEKGDHDKARVDIKNVLQINAGNARARLLFARLEERQQNWPQMYANLSAAVEADPKLIEARIKLAELLIAGNRADDAREQIDRALEQEPQNTEALAARAGLLFREQQLAEAEALCKRILEIEPGHITAVGLLAAIYGGTDADKALGTIEEGIRLNPENATLQMLRIQLLAKRNDEAAVIDAYHRLIEQWPQALLYPAQLAGYYGSLQRPEEAEATLRQALERNAENDQAKLLLVDFLVRNKKPEEALETLEQFIASSPDNYKLRTALSALYVALRRFDDAIATLQYAVDKDARSAEAIDARNRQTDIALALQQRDRADALIAEVLRIEPENGDALLTRARLAFAGDDPDAAIADLRTVLKNSPGSAPALELLALAQERTGSTSLALDSYQQLLQINSNNVPALVGASRLLLAQNKLEEAQKNLEQAQQLAPGNLEITRQLVDLHSRRQQWETALDLSRQLLINQQTAGVGHYLTGMVLARRKDHPAAIESMRNALAQEPRAIEPLQALINLYLTTGQLPAAIAYVEKHAGANPGQVHAREFLAALYKQDGRLDDAEKLLDEILRQEPGRTSAYRELAAVYIAGKQRERIPPLLLQGLQHSPDNAGLLLMLADTYQTSGKYREALDQYNRLEQLMPASDVVKNNLAVLLMEQFPSEENLRRAQALTSGFARSDNPVFLDTLGWLHYKMKNYPQSIPLLEDAVRKRPLPELHYHLGMAYLRNDMPERAKEQLVQATASGADFSGREEAENELRNL